MQFVIAAVRTAVQAAVGWLAFRGIDIDAGSLEVVALGLTTGVVVLVQRWLESKFPWLVQITSLGTAKSGPTY